MRPTATSGPTSATLASEPLALFSRATSAMVREATPRDVPALH